MGAAKRETTSKTMKILLTGVGAPGTKGTIHCLREGPSQPESPAWILGTDVNPDAVGRHFVDEFDTLPWPEDPTYIDEIEALCDKYKIDVVLPQTTREIVRLAGLKNVAVSSRGAIDAANDKSVLLLVVNLINGFADDFPAPEAHLCSTTAALVDAAKEIGLPCVVKPPVSNGSRGFRVLTPEPITTDEYLNQKPGNPQISLERFLEIVRDDMPRLLVMEYLPGPEYTVDCFRGENMFVAVVRLRKVVRSGITFETEVVDRPEIVEYCRLLVDALDLKYAFGFQFKENAEGVPMILECNPRVQGTMVASLFAGVNIPWMAVQESAGEPPTEIPIITPAKFTRYWGGVGESNGLAVTI